VAVVLLLKASGRSGGVIVAVNPLRSDDHQPATRGRPVSLCASAVRMEEIMQRSRLRLVEPARCLWSRCGMVLSVFRVQLKPTPRNNAKAGYYFQMLAKPDTTYKTQ
jgi:hypothetical protein